MMAAMRYTPEETIVEDYDSEDVAFMERVLEVWSLDAHDNAVRLGYPEAGNVWGIVTPVARRRILNLDQKQLIVVDREIAKLPWRDRELRCRKLVFVEYFSHEHQHARAKRFNVSVRTYFRRLKSLQQHLYNQLCPAIEAWPQRVLQRETE